MSKQALVISKEDLLKLPHSQLNENTIIFTSNDILNASFTLMSRDICETEESVVQILPYITLIDVATGDIFTYQRGNAGGEDRLKSKTSIGLGGHVEEQPLNMYNICETIESTAGVLAMNMIRELNEEVGLELEYVLLRQIQFDLLCGNFALFYSEQDQVAKHHLCLHYMLYISKNQASKLEEGCIVNPAWMKVEEIKDKHYENLEGWSQICLNFVKDEVVYDY